VSHLIGNKIPLDLDAKRLTKFFREEQGPISYLMFGITYDCQLKCRHCCVGHYENEPQRDLTTEEIKGVLDQLAKPMIVNFFGGEPTLRPDLMGLIRYAKDRALFVFVDTNGLVVTEDYAKQLKDNGLELLYVSIDSPDPRKHDEYRVMEGCFDKAVEAVKNALNVGLKTVVSTYVTKENLANGEFQDVINLAKDLGATGVRYVLPTPAGRWLHNFGVKLSPQEENKVREIAEFPYVCRDFYFQNQSSSACAGVAGKAYLYISPYGEVQPCCFIPLSFGNIRDESMSTILDRMWKHPMYKHKCMGTECPMLNGSFRKDYIDTIPQGTKLPYRLKY
jgi:MoaA/NifB/PqqE/SkfB family radical SAM enzyme